MTLHMHDSGSLRVDVHMTQLFLQYNNDMQSMEQNYLTCAKYVDAARFILNKPLSLKLGS